MQTTRFETFFDAILAIIITVLVLKIPQPASPTLEALFGLNTIYVAYLISFLILFNIWYANHNLFQVVDTIDNTSVWFYGTMTFVISLLPYFTIWLANNVYSIPAETMFGLIFIVTHILSTLATRAIYRSNPYNQELMDLHFDSYYMNLPIIILIIGFILTYTIYVPGIYVCCLLSNIMMETDRFEAFIDAILAIIITIIVLEIPLASSGSWEALYELRYEFIIYAVSFIVCFNFWNYNNNLFSIVNRIDPKVIWSMGITLFVFSLLPYFTTFVGENFYEFLPQFLYGLCFIITAILSMVIGEYLKKADPGNIALQLALADHYPMYSTIILVSIGIIIGYLFYPPAIMVSCLISIIFVWLMPKIRSHLN